MNRECFSVVVFDQSSSETRRFRIRNKTFYLLASLLFSLMLFFCDYIHIKKQAFDLNRLRQEARVQTSQIQFFTGRIEELEQRLSKLMDFNKRIRVIANLERNQEMVSFTGMEGIPSTDIREMWKPQHLAQNSSPVVLKTSSSF
jgi:hypothetical protein